MKKYKFMVRSPTGKKIKGHIKALDEDELVKMMTHIGCELLKYRECKVKGFKIEITKIKKSDLVAFLTKLQMMIKAGIVLSEAVTLAAKATPKKSLQKILEDVSKEMRKGKTLSNVLYEFPHVFPEYFITMFRIAEASGNIIEVIDHLILVYENEIKMKKKFLTSLFYPCILAGFSIIVIGVISFVIVPSFVEIFNEMRVELPLVTKIMISVTSFIKNYGLFVLLGILLIGLSFSLYLKSVKGKYFKDMLKLKLPVLRKLNKNSLTSRFCRSFKILTISGIPIVQSLSTIAYLLGNDYAKDRFDLVLEEVKKGYPLSNSLYSVDLFPELVLETINIGESTGNMEYSLGSLADIYDEETSSFLTRLSTLIEPFFILLIAMVVVVLVISIFVPLVSMLDNVGM